jgi:hypothetical protein
MYTPAFEVIFRFHSPIPDDGGPHITTYNNELMALEKDKKNTWFTAPWLFAEYVKQMPRLRYVSNSSLYF